MSRFDRYKYHGYRNKKCIAKPHEITRSGLAYTPADMERMTANGIPVQSGELAAKYYDGTADVKFSDITSDRIKTNDINDLWEEHQEIVSKTKEYHKSLKSKSKSE